MPEFDPRSGTFLFPVPEVPPDPSRGIVEILVQPIFFKYENELKEKKPRLTAISSPLPFKLKTFLGMFEKNFKSQFLPDRVFLIRPETRIEKTDIQSILQNETPKEITGWEKKDTWVKEKILNSESTIFLNYIELVRGKQPPFPDWTTEHPWHVLLVGT